MNWIDWIPTSMAMVGSLCLGLALILVFIDMPGGVDWNKVGAVCSLIGGFGVLGGAGGWIGQHIMSGSNTAVSWTREWAAQAIGVAAVAVVLLLAVAWAWSRINGKGIEAGGKGKASKKVRSLLVCAIFAIVGATIAGVIPELYDATNWVVNEAGTSFQTMVS